MKSVQQQLFSGRAYQIFVSEFHRHIEAAREVLDGDESVDGAARLRLGGYFHTIRGGAGFFCLRDIAERAGQLEKLFIDPVFSLENEIDFVRDLIIELEHLGTMLPAPAESLPQEARKS